MPSKESIYPRGQLAKTAKDIISNYPRNLNLFKVSDVLEQVKKILPLASDHSIKSLITYEYPKRGWVERTETQGVYKRLLGFGKRSPRMITGTGTKQPKGIITTKKPDDELSFVEIGRGIVAYVNELKTLADIIEEENVQLTNRVNELQDAFNKLKIEGGGSIHVRDIMKT